MNKSGEDDTNLTQFADRPPFEDVQSSLIPSRYSQASYNLWDEIGPSLQPGSFAMFDGFNFHDQRRSKISQLADTADKAFLLGDRATCVAAIADLYRLLDESDFKQSFEAN